MNTQRVDKQTIWTRHINNWEQSPLSQVAYCKETNLSLLTVEGRALSGNAKGNYESRMAFNINRELLKNSNSSWDRPPETLIKNKNTEQLILQFSTYHNTNLPKNYITWGWKDPRTVLTFDAWKTILDTNSKLVVIYRDPMLVAQSLKSRGDCSIKEGLDLWLHYNNKILEHIENHPAYIIRFDTPRNELMLQINYLVNELKLSNNIESIKNWFDSTLVRENKNNEVIQLPDSVLKTFNKLESLRHAETNVRKN
ncbi:MAG: hypothetical protein QM500_02225 [Methylococcales bacterium]